MCGILGIIGKEIGYFKSNYEEGLTINGQDFILLETEGTGHIVGVVMDMEGGLRPRHLEGDERVHIDRNNSPQLNGTGTEDFFNGGWYFNRGRFTLPLHGQVYGETYSSTRMICYRYFISDAINYYSKIRFGMEHGDVNDIYAYYKTLVYWYGINQSSINATDSLEIGDSIDEFEHQYQK